MDKKTFNADLRQEYHSVCMDIHAMADEPFEEFSKWWQHASDAQTPEMNAAVLATADPLGIVRARVILIKSFSQDGFLFFTNYDSQKGCDLQQNPNAALVIWWQNLSRQIRIQGKAEKTSVQESDQYFYSRPRDYQIGAWASKQSEKLMSPQELHEVYHRLQQEYATKPIARPPHWGGYRIVPNYFEFWLGGAHRLHDRVVYEQVDDQMWQRYTISP